LAELLFQKDSYLREFEAVITRIEENKVFLDKTAFHPRPAGGLDADTGILIGDSGQQVRVLDTVLYEGDVAHIVDNPTVLSVGMKVRGVIDWERRYRMMRLHTASHILAALLYERYGARVTGGHITPDVARDDFEINVENWKEVMRQALEETNRIAAKCIEVKVYWLPRKEALKLPGLVKLADRLPPDVDVLRIVEIPGVDVQADGGPHVRNTCEIGEVELVKLESRGKRRKRIYYRLKG
jgi:misacylated tRNA(Ala) deacylase